MSGYYGFSPNMLQMLSGLGMQGTPGVGAVNLPQVSGVPAGVQQQAGLPPELLQGLMQQSQAPAQPGFPTEAALLAGLGAAGMGLRAGAARPPAPTGSLPVASVPGRGLQAGPFVLPRGR